MQFSYLREMLFFIFKHMLLQQWTQLNGCYSTDSKYINLPHYCILSEDTDLLVFLR